MDRIDRFAPLSGLITAVLFAIGSAIWAFEQPPRDTGTEELLAFYEDTSTQIIVGGSLSLVSLFFVVWFGAVLRDRLAEAEGPRRTGLPLLAFGGALLTAAVGLGAESINMAGALSAEDGQLTGETAQIYFDVSYAFGAPAAGIAMATIAAPTALVALRSGSLLSRWAAWTLLAVAVLIATPIMQTEAFGAFFLIGLVFLGWLSVRLYANSR